MPYEKIERADGEGSLRIGKSLTFREDMYNLCFIAQVKTMYRESCEEKDQRLQDRLKQTQIQVLGDMPPTAPVIKEEDPVEEEEEKK